MLHWIAVYHLQSMPGGGVLRAMTPRRAADGCFYCMTRDGILFRFDPGSDEVESLGSGLGPGHYTTSIALSPGGRYIYYVPGAHGNAWKIGTPVVQYDIQSRQRKVLAFLEGYYEANHDYRFGGTFGVTASPDGSLLFTAMNGRKFDFAKEEGFGQPSLLVIHIAEAERPE